VNFFQILLFPFAIIYDIITRFRNHLFDIGYMKSMKFDVPVVSVGNIIAGGSGKTPMVEYLINLLSREHHVCTLSRGYGRRTRGFRLVNENDSALTVGDEPLQIFQKFQPKIQVAVGEERVTAVPEILFYKPETNLIILDDAFQHRYVTPHFSILLTEYSRPFYTDFVLPSGLLREARKGAKRADLIVVTKCPDTLEKKEAKAIAGKVHKYAKGKNVFFSGIEYGDLISFSGKEIRKTNQLILVSGIGNPQPFQAYLNKNFELIDSIRFPDHYKFRESDVQKIIDMARSFKNKISVVTTEKDFVRLKPFQKMISESGIDFCYIPIECDFLFEKNKFDKMVSDAIIAVKRKDY